MQNQNEGLEDQAPRRARSSRGDDESGPPARLWKTGLGDSPSEIGLNRKRVDQLPQTAVTEFLQRVDVLLAPELDDLFRQAVR